MQDGCNLFKEFGSNHQFFFFPLHGTLHGPLYHHVATEMKTSSVAQQEFYDREPAGVCQTVMTS